MRTFFAATLALSMLAAPAIAAPRDHQGAQQGQHQGQSNTKAQKRDRAKVQTTNKRHEKAQAQNNNKRRNHDQAQSRDRGGKHWAQRNHHRGHDARKQMTRQYSYNGRKHNAVRGPAWHAPRGHDARRVWNRGDRMHSSYRARSYVIDYRTYHLARPSYGYQWVRAGNNVYLVRASNGLVAQIVWNMFY